MNTINVNQLVQDRLLEIRKLDESFERVAQLTGTTNIDPSKNVPRQNILNGITELTTMLIKLMKRNYPSDQCDNFYDLYDKYQFDIIITKKEI